MKQIDTTKYVSYTIAGAGFNFTVFGLQKALKERDGFSFGTLYGTKFDGTRDVLDKKE